MLKKNASRIQNLEKIKVGNQPQDTMEFLSQNLEVSFNEDRGENPEVKSVTMKKIQSDQTGNHQKYLSNSKSSMQYHDKKECLIMWALWSIYYSLAINMIIFFIYLY